MRSMSLNFFKVFFTGLCAVFLVLIGIAQSDHIPENSIRLRSGIIDHDHDGLYSLKAFLRTKSKLGGIFRRDEDVPDGQWMVSLNVTPSEEITELVCKEYPCHYVHRGHYILRAPLSHIKLLEQSKEIKWIGVFDPSLKIDSSIKSEMKTSLRNVPRSQTDNIHDEFKSKSEFVIWLSGDLNDKEREGYLERVQSEWNREWEQHGVKIRVTQSQIVHAKVPGTIVSKFVKSISSKPDTLWIEKRKRFTTKNRFDASILQGGFNFDNVPAFSRGLDGSDQVLGIGDTGLQWNHTFFQYFSPNVSNNTSLEDPQLRNQLIEPRFLNVDMSPPPDFANATVPGKITVYYFYNDTDTVDSEEGHGTAVAGTALGNLNVSNFAYPFFGLAPGARISFADFNNNQTDAPDAIVPPVDLLTLGFIPLATLGGFIQSFSWGSTDTDYGMPSFLSDLYSFSIRDGLLLFAAGNEGVAQCCNMSSINSPASAKNTLAVGSSVSAQLPEVSIFDESGNLIFANHISIFFGETNEATFSKPLNGTPINGNMTMLTSWPCNEVPEDVSGSIVFLLAEGSMSPSCSPLTAVTNLQKAGANGVVILTDVGLIDVELDENVDPEINIPVVRLVAGYSDQIQEIGQNPSTGRVSLNRNLTSMIEDVSFFSSQGPTLDGRIKPDVVGPGEVVVTAHALAFAKFRSGIVTFAGSSFSTPAVAGIALLIRQYFMNGFYPSGVARSNSSFTPSGSLIKAMIVNSARRLTGIGYLNSTGSPNFQDLTRVSLADEVYPYPFQGHGRVNSDNVLFFNDSSFKLAIENQRNVTTGDVVTYKVDLNTSSLFAATMVFADPPGSVFAENPVVNSISLSLTLPNGSVIWGNQRRSAEDNSVFVQDTINNVQKVIFTADDAGTYLLNVTANSIPVRQRRSVQAYALVATNFTRFCFPSNGSDSSQCI